MLRWEVPLNFVPFSLNGLTLAIFLRFRNSASYTRWWEARNLCGALLIEARAAVRLTLTAVDDGPAQAPVLGRRLIALAHTLRLQLRGSNAGADLARLLPL